MLDIPQRPQGMFKGSPVLTSQKQWELDALIDLVRREVPYRPSVLEIGAQDGGTLYQWMKLAVPGLYNRIGAIDPHMPDSAMALWQGWAKDFGVDLMLCPGKSGDAAVMDGVIEFFTTGLDFLFIDGDHSYPACKDDFEFYGKLVRRGGIIALHDIKTPANPQQQHIQVRKLWKEIRQAGYKTQELHADPNDPWGGGIGVVYVD